GGHEELVERAERFGQIGRRVGAKDEEIPDVRAEQIAKRLVAGAVVRAGAHDLSALHEDGAAAAALERDFDARVLAPEPHDLQHVREIELAEAALHDADLHDGSSVCRRASSMPASCRCTRSASSPLRSAFWAPPSAASLSTMAEPRRIV